MATTINAYSVSIGLNADGLVKGGMLARNEVTAVRSALTSVVQPSEKVAKSLDAIETAYRKGAISADTYHAAVGRLQNKLVDLNKPVVSVTSSLQRLAAGYLSWQTVTKSIGLAIEAEQATAKFEVMAGSLNNAHALMRQLQDFANVSPVTLKGAQDAAAQMLAFNIPVQEISRNLKMLSDITGGNQQRFDSLSLAFSQMSAAGRLMGQDLLQMVNAGFNPLQQISKTTGESLIDLKKRMEDGGVSAAEVTNAFIAATSEGGRFHRMTEKMAETMGGKLQIAMADLDMALTKVGKSLSPLIISLTDGAKDGKSAIDGVTQAIATMSDGLGYAIALTRDLSGLTTVYGLMTDKDGEAFGNATRFLNLLEKRDREALEAKKQGELSVLEEVHVEKIEKVKEYIDVFEKMERESMQATQRAEQAHARQMWQEKEKQAIALEKRLAQRGGLSPSLEVGSAGAYSYLAGQKNDQVQKQIIIAETQRELTKELVSLTKLVQSGIDALADVSPKRIR